jgi:hypothetical protein
MFTVSILFALLLSGCVSEKEIILKNRNYDEVYVKTIQFIVSKGWNITFENKETGTIQAVLGEYQSSGKTRGNIYTYGDGRYGRFEGSTQSPQEYKDKLAVLIYKIDENTIKIELRGDAGSIVMWQPEETFQEYAKYISQ